MLYLKRDVVLVAATVLSATTVMVSALIMLSKNWAQGKGSISNMTTVRGVACVRQNVLAVPSR